MNNATALRLLAVLGVLVLASVLGLREIKAQGADWMPVRYVRVEGAFQYIAKETVRGVLTDFTTQISSGFRGQSSPCRGRTVSRCKGSGRTR